MVSQTILIVEDEEDVQELIGYNLRKHGYQTEAALDGKTALSKAQAGKPDLVLLDLMIPRIDGLQVCRILKSDSSTAKIPIIILTAKGTETDIVTGLEAGADDYITKPFSPQVLLARVKAVLRRHTEPPPGEQAVIKIHNIEIDPGRHRTYVNGKEVELTSSEFKMLHFLAGHPGWVFTRYQIVDAVHGSDYPVTDRSVDVQIVGLRKKLGKAGDFIETVRGVGYRFREEI
ncbi:MAG TPA: response regulator [Anaerohalosphaeraceae bacterium]|jgi:two-component system phosphate regulon response regulator PhoB|nr:response regulator [Anaerohalosphaeraceae bacterium]HPB92352.1 response regulator [Anaerohalosphaeraceae bacterium]HRT22965.1 response regulator [Anaerohalosphaeraceae bacterium]HRU14653.1 response regulator [Anaerohalosphaeraceae bacterium]